MSLVSNSVHYRTGICKCRDIGCSRIASWPFHEMPCSKIPSRIVSINVHEDKEDKDGGVPLSCVFSRISSKFSGVSL